MVGEREGMNMKERYKLTFAVFCFLIYLFIENWMSFFFNMTKFDNFSSFFKDL